MKSKKILSLALVAAIILSMQTNAFAAAVSESDVVPDAASEDGIAVVQESEAEQPCETQVVDDTAASQDDGESTEVAAIQEAFDDSAEIAAYSEDTADEAVEAESENIVSGKCGENLTWTLDTETGVLTISGDGDMDDYDSWSSRDYTSTIKEVKFDGNITSIGDGAFWDCYNLTSVTIPDSVTSIGDSAFRYCDSLPSITIPDSVTSIGEDAFYCCSGLTSVTLGNSVTSIGDRAFEDCYSLPSITIPDSVTSIGDSAFWNCSSLTSVTIGNSVISIGSCAFYDCSNLPSITIPDSVTSIGEDAFYYCYGLTSIDVSSGNESYISKDGVLFSNDFSSLICYPEGKSGDYIIPDGVTSIGDGAFYYCSNLTSVTIPNSVTSIGNSAFHECYNLPSITIPDSVTSIGDWAFFWCDSLTSVTIGNSVTSIGDHAFEYCSSLTSATIPASGVSIGTGNELLRIAAGETISGECGENLTWSLNTGTGVLTISGDGDMDDYSWSDSPWDDYTSAIKEVKFDGNVTSIGDYAFYNCSNLTSATIPASGVSIGTGNEFLRIAAGETISGKCGDNLTYTFDSSGVLTISGNGDMWDFGGYDEVYSPWLHFSNLIKKVEFNGNITSIGNCAFDAIFDEEWYYNNLTSITIPDSVTSIGDYAFFGCGSLTSATIPASGVSIGKGNEALRIAAGEIFSGQCGDNLTYTFDASHVLTISGDGDMWDFCGTLWQDFRDLIYKVEFDGNVTSIGEYAFNANVDNNWDTDRLASIIIPKSITSVSSSAFRGCGSLTDVYYTGSEEDWKKIQNKGWDDVYFIGIIISDHATIHYNYVPESDAPEVGDANGDGAINGKDSTLLMQYLAEWDVDIDESAADVNKDGVVNGKDSTLLMQYLAEWDVTLG